MTVGTFILDKSPKPPLLKSFDGGVVAWDFFWEIDYNFLINVLKIIETSQYVNKLGKKFKVTKSHTLGIELFKYNPVVLLLNRKKKRKKPLKVIEKNVAIAFRSLLFDNILSFIQAVNIP